MADTLSLADLSRATLARQMLLAREKVSPVRAVERLLAIQAQWPKPPFVALFSRLPGFERSDFTKLARKNALVRGTSFRGTIFVTTAKDYAAFRGTIQQSLERAIKSVVGSRLSSADHDRIVARGRALFRERPRTFDELRDELSKTAKPSDDVRRMAYLIRLRLPLLQVATDVAWGWHGACDFGLAEDMIDEPIQSEPNHDALVLRYLAALGPATILDAQNFTGVPGLKATFERLRPKLVTFRDEKKRELFDLPKAPRPDGTTVAPVRFLPEFDNVVLGHADRERFVANEHKVFVYLPGLVVSRTFLLDGRVAGTWKVDTSKKEATLVVEPFAKLAKKSKAAIEDEGESLLQFVEPEARTRTLRFAQPRG